MLNSITLTDNHVAINTSTSTLAQLSALQQQFFGYDWLSPFKANNIPTTDVFAKDNQLVVEAHLPNFKQYNVNIHVGGGDLIIQAQRYEKEEDKSKRYVTVMSKGRDLHPL